MPRDRRANIGTGLWSERSIRALTRRQRDAYLLVYTQPDLNRCGVLTYRLRYLAGLAVDSTEEQLLEDFRDLHNNTSRHLVLDETDEQLLIRTFVKHDGFLGQPLVVASMVRDYSRITSPTIQTAFLAEIRRLWDDPTLEPGHHVGLELVLGANPTDVGIKNADRVTAAMKGGLLGDLIIAVREGRVEPFPAKGLPKGLSEGQREGLTTGQGGGTADPPASATAPATAPATATAPAPATATTRHPPDDPTGALLAEHAAAFTTPPPPSALAPVKTAVMRLVADGAQPTHISAGLAKMRAKQLSARHLPELVAESIPVNGTGRRSTTDQRVADALDIAARYEEAGQ